MFIQNQLKSLENKIKHNFLPLFNTNSPDKKCKYDKKCKNKICHPCQRTRIRSKIFEYYSAIFMTNTYQTPYYVWEQIET